MNPNGGEVLHENFLNMLNNLFWYSDACRDNSSPSITSNVSNLNGTGCEINVDIGNLDDLFKNNNADDVHFKIIAAKKCE